MASVKVVVLVVFLVFCASGGLGVLLDEVKPGWFPVPLSFRVGKVVELVFCMVFYGMDVLGLIRIEGSVIGNVVDEKKFMGGLLLLCFGIMGHCAMMIVFH